MAQQSDPGQKQPEPKADTNGTLAIVSKYLSVAGAQDEDPES